MFNKLFTPLNLRNITLPGRAVRSATELFCSYPDAHVYPFEFDIYKELAQSRLGMILTAHTCVSPEGRSNVWQNGIWSDEFIEDAAKIAAAGSANGTPVVMQLGHGGMKADGNNGGRRVYTPDNMTEGEIAGVIRAFGAAAKRALQAGYAGVMLHGAHMYLLSQFFYPEYNHRTDRYGGHAENRFRIVREIFEEVKTICGDDFPVFLKINGDDRTNTAAYHEDIVTALNLCDRLGLDAAEISGWDSARRGVPEGPYFLENITKLHTETSLPLIAVGGIRTMQDIDQIFEAGACAVSMSRPLLQNPQILTDLETGKKSGCTGCCSCFNPLKNDVRCPFRKK